MIRAVADTNVLISGIFWPGLNRLILNLARHEVLSLHGSPVLIQEFTRTLKGKKFRLSDAELDPILRDLMGYLVPTEGVPVSLPHLRDPEDLFLCSLAVGSAAHYLITGDRDLLTLKSVKKIPVVTPRAFLAAEFSEVLDAFEQR